MQRSQRFRHALAAVGFLSMVVLILAGCGRREPEPEPIRAVRTMQVNDGLSAPQREYAAEVRSRTEARLSFRVGGKIVARQVELGQSVKAGQVLAQLDPEDLRQSQEVARAALAAAQANLELSAADHQRFKELRDQGFISAAELERRSMALKTAQAQVDQAKAQATVQRNQAAYSTLVASAAGVVVAVDADVGAVVSPGMPVVRLAVDGPRDAVFSVPEDALVPMRQLLKQGGALQVRLWGVAQPVSATLRELAASADPVTRTYQAKADLGRSSAALGQTAAVLVTSAPTPGVFRLPLSALVRQQERVAVWVVDRGTMTVSQRVVQVQGADGNEALVVAGLQPGLDVVTAGAHVLTKGQKVKFYEAPKAVALAASGSKP